MAKKKGGWLKTNLIWNVSSGMVHASSNTIPPPVFWIFLATVADESKNKNPKWKICLEESISSAEMVIIFKSRLYIMWTTLKGKNQRLAGRLNLLQWSHDAQTHTATLKWMQYARPRWLHITGLNGGDYSIAQMVVFTWQAQERAGGY